MTVDTKAARDQIPATSHCIYLNTGWSGPPPLPVTQAIIDGLRRESEQGPTTRPTMEWHLEVRTQVRQAFARLLGTDVAEIALTQNTTEGLNLVANGLSLSNGDTVVTCAPEHGSVTVPCYYLRERRGVTLRFVRLSRDDTKESLLAKFAEALDAGRPRLAFMSHISYAIGMRLPLKEICHLAHQRGALVLVDGAQTAGHIALDLKDLDVDFYSIPGHKWLLGPDGVGALYVRRDLIAQVETVKTGGGSVESYDFEGNFVPKHDDIRKFELSTSNVPLWAGLIAATEFFTSLGGVSATEQTLLPLAAQTRDYLKAIPGVQVLSPDGDLASGLVTFSVDGVEPDVVTAQLWERGRIVCRTVSVVGGTRLSVAFFNTEEEIQQVANLIEDISKSGPAASDQSVSAVERQGIQEL